MSQTKVKGSMLDLTSPFDATGISIVGGTALTAPAADDSALLYDLSATANRKITLENFFKVIALITADTAPDVADSLLTYDASASAAKVITITNFFKTINALTEDTAPVITDFLATYDTSATGGKKVALSKFGLLGAVGAWTKSQAGVPVALTSSAASIAVDFSLGNNFEHTFTENTTIANPSNIVAGQSGFIALTQHASSPKTLAFGSYYNFEGGTAPTVTATNSAMDLLVYYARSTTVLDCTSLLNLS